MSTSVQPTLLVRVEGTPLDGVKPGGHVDCGRGHEKVGHAPPGPVTTDVVRVACGAHGAGVIGGQSGAAVVVCGTARTPLFGASACLPVLTGSRPREGWDLRCSEA